MGLFLSTPSARRATRSGWPAGYRLAISIHALREEGDVPGADDVPHRGISIHALREEGDRAVMQQLGRRTGFLSTPSARRATT